MDLEFSSTSITQIYNSIGFNIEKTIREAVSEIELGKTSRWLLSELDGRPLKVAMIERQGDGYYLYFSKNMTPMNGRNTNSVDFFTVDELANMFSSPFLKDYDFAKKSGRTDVPMALGPFNYSQTLDFLKFFNLKNISSELSNQANSVVQQYESKLGLGKPQ